MLDSLNRGGAEMLALDVCRNALSSGMDLTFVATGGGDLEAEFRDSGADFVRLERRLPVDLDLAASLRRVIDERAIRVVHCHQAVEAAHALLATRGTAVKRVLSFHLGEADAKNRLALKFIAPRVDANVAVSRDLLARLKSEAGFDTGRNFHVVHNGVDAARLRAAGRGRLREELALGPEDLLFGTIGNFYPDGRKDPMTACRALPQLFERAPRAQFVFVGGRSEDAPQLYDECVAFCRERAITAGRVHFTGKRADIPEILNSLDVFVLPSRREGFGIAAVEAMLAGVPAVLSDIGPLAEVSGGGEYASLFRAGDADDLARRLVELAREPERRALLAARAKEWAARQFGIEAHIAALLRLYESLVNSS